MMAIVREEVKYLDFDDVSTGRRLASVHPGTILLEDFITPMRLSQYWVAMQSGIQQQTIDGICAGTQGITTDTAFSLAHLFGTDASFWTNLQLQYDLETAA